jgi:glycosyltransferase involved in cell wall biosynthesis
MDRNRNIACNLRESVAFEGHSLVSKPVGAMVQYLGMVNDAPQVREETRHLLHVFPSFAIGGAQVRFVQLANALGARYRHSIIALDGRFDMVGAISSSVDWSAVALRNFNKAATIRNVRKFRRMLWEIAPDLLVTYNWSAVEWCLANRLRPLLPNLHIEDGFGHEERDRQLFRRAITRRIALSGDQTHVVVPSHVLEGIALRQWHLPKRNVIYIPNGVDCARFKPRPEGPPPFGKSVTIGTVSSLRPEKRLDRLIEAFAAASAALPGIPLMLVIVGDGPERTTLEAAARATPVAKNIRFTGVTDAPEDEVQAMDIFALSSDTEQMPLSVLEAMACALPVAAFAVGDVAEMVSKPNSPYVVAKADQKGLEGALLSLIQSAELRRHIGRANREAALSCFSHAAMVSRYADLFG